MNIEIGNYVKLKESEIVGVVEEIHDLEVFDSQGDSIPGAKMITVLWPKDDGAVLRDTISSVELDVTEAPVAEVTE